MTTAVSSAWSKNDPIVRVGEPRLPDPATPIVPGSVVFAADRWDLSALCPRPTTRWIVLNFSRCPSTLRLDLKHFFYLLLTMDTPLEQLDRPASARKRLAPSTLKTLFEDLTPFLGWLQDRGTPTLNELSEQDLHEYADHVAVAPIGQNPKMRRLFALSRLWLMAPYLRSSGRLRQPFWERDGLEQIVGKSEWSAENKSAPIHPVTMSTLLVWCLRIIEEAPQLRPVVRLDPTPATSREPDEATTTPAGTWTGEISPQDRDPLRRLVTTACLITVAYLAGMRADEVLGLRRGCCTPSTTNNRRARAYEIRGRTYKSAVAEGRSIPAGVERDVPWAAIKPVADAIAVMENLHSSDLLFSASLFKARVTGPSLDPGAPTSNQVRESIERLITWCNYRAIELGRPNDSIPADPDGGISLRRLRRTLAWFIYRKPSGRVALGIQYGHLHAATTDGYGGRASAGLRDLFPMEEAFAISDTLHEAVDQLQDNPTVSGPAAARYHAAVNEYQHRYQGLTLTPKQAAALMTNPDLQVHDSEGQTLACCFDAQKALCRKETNPTRVATTPDLTACEDRCANIARTDRHIAAIEVDVSALQAELAAPLTPVPLRHRIELQILHREAIVRAHYDTREGRS